MKQLAVPAFTVFGETRHDCAVRAARAPDNRSRQRPRPRRQSDNMDRHRWTERFLESSTSSSDRNPLIRIEFHAATFRFAFLSLPRRAVSSQLIQRVPDHGEIMLRPARRRSRGGLPRHGDVAESRANRRQAVPWLLFQPFPKAGEPAPSGHDAATAGAQAP